MLPEWTRGRRYAGGSWTGFANIMRQNNSLAVVSGLVFVAVFLVMIVSVSQVSKAVQHPFGPPAATGYDLAGSSQPVR